MRGPGFAEKLLAFLGKIEATVKSLVIFGCFALLCSQLLLTQVPARKYLSYVEQIEGQQIQGNQIKFAEEPLAIEEKSVTAAPDASTNVVSRLLVISLLEALPQDKPVVIVNGLKIYPFIQGEVAVNVQDGDVLEIDGSGMDRRLKFCIFAPHNDVEFPVSGSTAETNGNKAALGKVRFKQ